MKKKIRFMLAVLVLVSGVSFTARAADTSKTTQYPVGTVLKDGQPVNQPLPQPVPKPAQPISGTGVTPVAEGNRLGGSVTVDPPPCSSFIYAGDTILPVHRGEYYLCPAGYDCKGVTGGVQCRWRGLTRMASTDPGCRETGCARW